jgi:hypothetical protein
MSKIINFSEFDLVSQDVEDCQLNDGSFSDVLVNTYIAMGTINFKKNEINFFEIESFEAFENYLSYKVLELLLLDDRDIIQEDEIVIEKIYLQTTDIMIDFVAKHQEVIENEDITNVQEIDIT